MLMAEETKAQLNKVLTHSFLLNMICDNLVYEMDFYVYPNASGLVHEKFAHYWPTVADQWSDLMIQLNAKPERYDLIHQVTDHDGDLADIFAEMKTATDDYRQEILKLIEIAEYNNDVEVKIKGEEILSVVSVYLKQADIWATEAIRYKDNYKAFDARIGSFTRMI